LLAGQIPYKEFMDYLGLGHLYAGSLMTKLMGGSYGDSLAAFRFLSFLSFGMIFCVLGYAITHRLEISLSITNVVLILVLCGYRFGVLSDRIWVDAVTVGNSARFIRSLILPLVCVLCIAGLKGAPRMLEGAPKLKKHPNMMIAVGLGVVGGMALVWSNDYGISCWVCFLIMNMCLLFFRTRNIKTTLIYSIFHIAVSCVILFVVVQIVTFGHFSQWLGSTFGSGSYQSWYYNSGKSFYIFQVDFSFLRLVQALLTVIYLTKLWRCHGSLEGIIRFGIPAFANMVGFCAANEYKLLSGDRASEMANAILYATILFEVTYLMLKFCKKKQVWSAVLLSSVIITGVWLGYEAKVLIYLHDMPQAAFSGTYVPEIDSNVITRHEDIIAADEFLHGEKVFSTYASAQEVVSGYFQPSGVDYIIHVLGDKTREEYLESFRNGDFHYTATIKRTSEPFSAWEDWIRHSNWFFYRELYQNWHKVFSNGYQVYWERNEIEGENTIILDDVDISVEVLDDGTSRIIIQTDPSINGTADVLIDYAVKVGDGLGSKLIINKMLYVREGTPDIEEEYSTWFLRSESREYVPVNIRNGYGHLDLLSMPDASTKLDIFEVNCERVFVVENYVELISLQKKRIHVCLPSHPMKPIASFLKLQKVSVSMTRHTRSSEFQRTVTLFP
jgi:hypothetical protein